jgi:hypothetical protein
MSRRLPAERTASPARDRARPAAPPAPAPAFADPRLRHARSDVLRATLARQAQGLIGNRAVGNILARANPVAASAPEHFSGAEVDAKLAASPFLAPYIKPKVEAGRLVAGSIHHHPSAEFEALCIAYSTGKINPDTGELYTAAEAAEHAKLVNGFHDDVADEIHVNADRGDGVTDLHEAIHHYRHATWRAKVRRNVDEGFTECFTRRLCADTRTPNPNPRYPQQFGSAHKLVAAVEWERAAAAYFNGEWIELANAFDALDPENGMGNFYLWLRAMDEGRYKDADALVPDR